METVTQTQYIDKKVLIKEGGSGMQDKIYIVRGLPKHLLFDEKGIVLPGIEKSATGDGGFVFYTPLRESQERLEVLDHYIESMHPRHLPRPKRIPNAEVPGDSRSSPLSMDKLQDRYKQMFGYSFIDLPMDERPIGSLHVETESQVANRSYANPDFVNPDSMKVVEQKESEVAKSNLYCGECDYIGKNQKGLRFHITRMHKKGKENGLNDNS